MQYIIKESVKFLVVFIENISHRWKILQNAFYIPYYSYI
jgi:hypothetical protein